MVQESLFFEIVLLQIISFSVKTAPDFLQNEKKYEYQEAFCDFFYFYSVFVFFHLVNLIVDRVVH